MTETQTTNGYRKYTAEEMARALREAKGMVSPAARAIGADPKTVRSYIKQYASVREAQKDAREEMIDVGELALRRAVQNGEGWAVCFTLKTIGKSRGYVERTEHTGKDGKDFTIRVVYDGSGS